MKLYKPSKNYLEYICALDEHLLYLDTIISIVIRMNEQIYLIPIVSISESDFNKQGDVRKSTPSIIRMIDLISQNCIGKCLLSNMFPIPYKEIEVYDLKSNDETTLLFEKKIEYVRKNLTRITKAAIRLYKQKTKGYKQKYLNETVDFKLLEEAAYRWEIEHYGKHYNRFPDSHYFLTNPYTEGMTDYFLMNKNIKVAKVTMDNVKQNIVQIIELLNSNYAPIECFSNGRLTANEITNWFRGRGIPSWRDGLDDFLDNIGIKNKDILLNKAFGLSLSDQYWMNPVDLQMDWEDINFFDHDFNSQDYLGAIFENKILNTREVDLYTPNNTSNGMLKKTWIVGADGKRYLLKGSLNQTEMEPLNEVLATMICEAIRLEHVPYVIETSNNILLTKCECFITKNTELISAYAVLKNSGANFDNKNENLYKKYISVLKDKGIEQVEIKLAKMFLLDYIIANKDRHLGNFGIIRNVDNLNWIDVAPIFDSGQAMFSQKEIYEMNFNSVLGCFFNRKNMDFDIIFKTAVKTVQLDINFEKLLKVADKWKKVLITYQHLSKCSDERIDILYNGLKSRIDRLKYKFY